MGVQGSAQAALVYGHARSDLCQPVGFSICDPGLDSLGGLVKQGKITVHIESKGDEWPDEEIEAIKKFLEGRGYTNTAEGSGGTDNVPRWWAVNYERKINK